MRRRAAASCGSAGALTLLLLLTACTADGGGPPAPTQAANPFASPTPSPLPTPSDSGSGGAPGGAGATVARWPDVAERAGPSVVTVIAGANRGSGVVYGSLGTIVTMAHVVGAAKRAELVFADGTRSSGTVTGMDAVAGLALIRSERGGLVPIAAATALPPPGTEVLAVGGPGAPLVRALAGGIAPARPGTGRSLTDVLQLDAAILPVSSGAAILDADGHLAAIAETPAAGRPQPGFAIPVQTVTSVADRLLAGTTIRHASLGIRPSPVSLQISQMFRLGVIEGVLVQDVTPGGAAARAGIRGGDVLTAIGGERITSMAGYLRLLAATAPAQAVPVTLSRAGQVQQVSVTPTLLTR